MKSMNKKERILLLEVEEILAAASAILLVVAAFMPWGSSANASITGIEGQDSLFTIGIGIVALITLVIKRVPNFIPLILGVAAFAIALNDFFAMSQLTKALEGGVGYGLYLTVLGSLGVFLGTTIEVIRSGGRRKIRT